VVQEQLDLARLRIEKRHRQPLGALAQARPRDRKRIDFAYACDGEVMDVFQLCARMEGIIPALESTHALVHGLKRAKEMRSDQILVISLSGRGDKDVNQVAKILGEKIS